MEVLVNSEDLKKIFIQLTSRQIKQQQQTKRWTLERYCQGGASKDFDSSLCISS